MLVYPRAATWAGAIETHEYIWLLYSYIEKTLPEVSSQQSRAEQSRCTNWQTAPVWDHKLTEWDKPTFVFKRRAKEICSLPPPHLSVFCCHFLCPLQHLAILKITWNYGEI